LAKDIECVILGASKPSQIEDSLKALDDPKLTKGELLEIEDIIHRF
jgi:aryl-alcohol dehydrogenase-like predicted oxidoreductase